MEVTTRNARHSLYNSNYCHRNDFSQSLLKTRSTLLSANLRKLWLMRTGSAVLLEATKNCGAWVSGFLSNTSYRWSLLVELKELASVRVQEGIKQLPALIVAVFSFSAFFPYQRDTAQPLTFRRITIEILHFAVCSSDSPLHDPLVVFLRATSVKKNDTVPYWAAAAVLAHYLYNLPLSKLPGGIWLASLRSVRTPDANSQCKQQPPTCKQQPQRQCKLQGGWWW